MMNIKEFNYYPRQEEIVKILKGRVNTSNEEYLRTVTVYHLAEIASGMRATVKDDVLCVDPVPINVYACILMPSGAGKNHSNNILELNIMKQFKYDFFNKYLPRKLRENIKDMATKEAIETDTDYAAVEANLIKESESYGELYYNFDGATAPAFKQLRAKAQMCKCGSLNLICDEIGNNLAQNDELVPVLLEMYDLGLGKNKIIKNTKENIRFKERNIPIPVNVLWFGTPTALLDGSTTEDLFFRYLDTGFARRMFFAIGEVDFNVAETLEEFMARKLKANESTSINSIAEYLASLVDDIYLDRVLTTDLEASTLLAEYHLWNRERASKVLDIEAIKKNELINRHFKCLKLAGLYAFLDKSSVITKAHIEYAIKFTEASGECLEKILHREENFVKLAKFLKQEAFKEFTKADLEQQLVFFKNQKNETNRNEMIIRAQEWGYKNNVIISQYSKGRLNFIKGEPLEETNLNRLIISSIMANGDYQKVYPYTNSYVSFKELANLGKITGAFWCNHHLLPNPECPDNGPYRKEECAKEGFNLIVLDIDHFGSINLEWVKEYFAKYYYFIYTTKRSTDEDPRFRLVLPIKYTLYLTADNFKSFMENFCEDLPFSGLDEGTFQRARQWLTNEGITYVNDSVDLELFNPTKYIPNTSQCEELKATYKPYEKLDHIERWFILHATEGSRNNHLFRYARLLLDKGLTPQQVHDKVMDLNSRLSIPLSEEELNYTVLSKIG